MSQDRFSAKLGSLTVENGIIPLLLYSPSSLGVGIVSRSWMTRGRSGNDSYSLSVPR